MASSYERISLHSPDQFYAGAVVFGVSALVAVAGLAHQVRVHLRTTGQFEELRKKASRASSEIKRQFRAQDSDDDEDEEQQEREEEEARASTEANKKNPKNLKKIAMLGFVCVSMSLRSGWLYVSHFDKKWEGADAALTIMDSLSLLTQFTGQSIMIKTWVSGRVGGARCYAVLALPSHPLAAATSQAELSTMHMDKTENRRRIRIAFAVLNVAVYACVLGTAADSSADVQVGVAAQGSRDMTSSVVVFL
jgi:hypothetical protein